MFFHISRTAQDNFPYNHVTENFVINLDEGWHQTVDQNNNKIWYKGYLDQGQLSDHVVEITNEEEPKHSGNFCAIKVFDRGLIIRTDRLRSFPIWYDVDQGLTNLQPFKETYWTDSYVMLNNDFSIIHSKYDAIGPIDDSEISLESVVTQIDQILDQKTQEFIAYNKYPIRVFLSGGIDTALVYSYIQKHTDDYELIPYSHCDFDYFYLKNHKTLSELWGYTQIHHWKDPCVLASGAPGDEFTARSPTTANLLLLHHGLSIPKLLNTSEYKDCLHSEYYDNLDYHKLWAEQEQGYSHKSLKDTIYECCHYNINDWQHWHFGNTLTWTPLRDLRIFKLIARLPIDDLKQQIMDSVIQRRLIGKNDLEILNYLSNKKNSANYFENLTRLYCK
jgi:hypothetical protein